MRDMRVYTKIPRSQATRQGWKVIATRWIDINKGDDEHPNYRSRLVGKELKAKTKDTLMAHELFSSMPPREMVENLLSLLVTD